MSHSNFRFHSGASLLYLCNMQSCSARRIFPTALFTLLAPCSSLPSSFDLFLCMLTVCSRLRLSIHTPQPHFHDGCRQHVPPGHGKPSTQSRNLRRRLRKQAMKPQSLENAGQVQDVAEQNVNRSLGPLQAPAIPTPAVMMEAFQSKNKNKRKGLRSAPIVRKIVFSDLNQ